MKLKVVAWVDYSDDFPCGDNGWAARNAIIDDIRANDYYFLGYHHVEYSYCTPVLNDGKKYCFSQQGWSDLMTEAHRFFGEKDYADYYIPDEIDEQMMLFTAKTHRPGYSAVKVNAEQNLNETIEIAVTERQFDRAANKGELRFADFFRAANEGEPSADCEKLRRVYNGDILVLVCGDKRANYVVTHAERRRVANSKNYDRLRPIIRGDDRRAAKRAKWEYDLSTLTLVITLAKQN